MVIEMGLFNKIPMNLGQAEVLKQELERDKKYKDIHIGLLKDIIDKQNEIIQLVVAQNQTLQNNVPIPKEYLKIEE